MGQGRGLLRLGGAPWIGRGYLDRGVDSKDWVELLGLGGDSGAEVRETQGRGGDSWAWVELLGVGGDSWAWVELLRVGGDWG